MDLQMHKIRCVNYAHFAKSGHILYKDDYNYLIALCKVQQAQFYKYLNVFSELPIVSVNVLLYWHP